MKEKKKILDPLESPKRHGPEKRKSSQALFQPVPQRRSPSK